MYKSDYKFEKNKLLMTELTMLLSFIHTNNTLIKNLNKLNFQMPNKFNIFRSKAARKS